MVDIGVLASTALASVQGYLGSKATAFADEAAKAVGGKVLSWLRTKLSDPAERGALDSLVANPQSAGAQKMVEGALLSRLEADKSLAEDLTRLLEAAGHKIEANQTITQSGDGNQAAQVAGADNVVKINRD